MMSVMYYEEVPGCLKSLRHGPLANVLSSKETTGGEFRVYRAFV